MQSQKCHNANSYTRKVYNIHPLTARTSLNLHPKILQPLARRHCVCLCERHLVRVLVEPTLSRIPQSPLIYQLVLTLVLEMSQELVLSCTVKFVELLFGILGNLVGVNVVVDIQIRCRALLGVRVQRIVIDHARP